MAGDGYDHVALLDGIAWDWVNKKLYWTDAGDKDLEVYDPSTGCRRVLVKTGENSKPRAIVVDPNTRYLWEIIIGEQSKPHTNLSSRAIEIEKCM